MTRVIILTILVAMWWAASEGDALAQPAPSSGKSLDERFQEFDRNGDGKLTPDEFPAKRIFQEADTNKDDFLTRDELRAHFQRQSAPRAKPGAAKPSSPGGKTALAPGKTGRDHPIDTGISKWSCYCSAPIENVLDRAKPGLWMWYRPGERAEMSISYTSSPLLTSPAQRRSIRPSKTDFPVASSIAANRSRPK